MPYYLEGQRLRVCASFLREHDNIRLLKQCRLILLQHILPTTEALIGHLLQAGAEIDVLYAKPFSIERDVFKRLSQTVSIVRKSYEELEKTDHLDKALAAAVAKSRKDGKRILILEVGGYFAGALSRLAAPNIEFVAGVVEDTTFGHNRYVRSASAIPVQIYSVARSHLKWIEGRFVGRDAVLAMDKVLREQGLTITGRNALVVGFGMIGMNVARTLKAFDFQVSVFDKEAHRNLAAYIDGYKVGKKIDLIREADVIFSQTAETSMTIEDIMRCKNNTVLASVGSKDTEFDISSLRQRAEKCETIGRYLEKFILPNRRSIVVVKGGAAVNFILPSLPEELLDLIFSEMTLCGIRILRDANPTGVGVVNRSDSAILNGIARRWLEFINPS